MQYLHVIENPCGIAPSSLGIKAMYLTVIFISLYATPPFLSKICFLPRLTAFDNFLSEDTCSCWNCKILRINQLVPVNSSYNGEWNFLFNVAFSFSVPCALCSLIFVISGKGFFS